MNTQTEIKNQVREFYNQIGWQEVSEGIYQNARYEDLRPVSREYIHRCHMRVKSQLNPVGHFMLDAGSGPIQYPEYLEYSHGYRYRVCVDISILALQEARQRIGDHGLYVVGDIANLPFKRDLFDGVVSLHTIHHLPGDEHLQAYCDLYRVLGPKKEAVVVNGWPSPRLMRVADPFIRFSNRTRGVVRRILGKPRPASTVKKPKQKTTAMPKGTFINRHDVAWVKDEVGTHMPVEILVWRSVSVRFLRSLIHPNIGGHWWLRVLFWLEERFPHFFGENGQYPLIIISKE